MIQHTYRSFFILCVVTAFFGSRADGQTPGNAPEGELSFNLPGFRLALLPASQTVAALSPATDPEFDFTPSDRLEKRMQNGFYHLGDLNFRIKTLSDSTWQSYSTASARKPVRLLDQQAGNILTAADLANSLPDSLPLQVIRSWEKEGNQLILRFRLKNRHTKPLEIGALGIPMIFNNILTDKDLDEAHAENVFFDPYTGLDAGYLQVVRLSGEGPVLLVIPEGSTPFEAWRPLLDDPTPRGTTFEGFHEWMIHSKAYAEKEWKNAQQWNTPTSKILKPGETYEVGLRFLLTGQVENIENTLAANRRPVAVGIPGYVLPMDVKGSLYLNYPEKIKAISVEPQGALNVAANGPTKNGWKSYTLDGKQWGRARLTITWADGLRQSIHYKVIKAEAEVVADNGRFLLSKQWFEQPDDPFDRSPSVITYDYEKQEQVTQDSRAWIAGLSDEGGAGSWLNAIMKQLVQPDPEEIGKLEDFVNQTLWGGIQYSQGPLQYGVRKSLFFYEPDSLPAGTYRNDINFKTWAAWNRKGAEVTNRSYNYPHVAAAHWVMYRLARNYQGLITQRSWQWYLENAFHTAMAMTEQAPHYAQFGQMEGTVFLLILNDLKNEGMSQIATELEKTMKARADHWATLGYPFGSEMSWDSTGQEEVYMWSDYFGYDDKALVTLKAILAYMPTVPHWAYNGNARRYWDFLYGGKLSRIERQIHHYGSGLNAIPVLHQFKKEPENFYLLRVGSGGVLGTLSNITRDGFAPCAFHSFPSTLEIDGISGDYGPGFFGYAVNSATRVTRHDEFGWLAFGGNIARQKDRITVQPTTAGRSRVFIAPLKLDLSLEAGSFESVTFNPETGEVKLVLTARNTFTSEALLRIETDQEYLLKDYRKNERALFVIQLSDKPTTISLNIVK